MRFLSQWSKPKGCIGVELSSDSLRVAARTKAGVPELDKAFVVQAEKGEASIISWSDTLENLVAKQGLQNMLCNVSLGSGEYQLLLVEAPDVPDEEMLEAIRWRVKDLINEPIENAVMDIFKLPDDAARGGKTMVYVVVSNLAKIKSIIELVNGSGLTLHAIDIEVLALRNLVLLKEANRAVAVVKLRQGQGDVSIFREGNLYLSRNFHINFSGGLLEDLPVDALALEIQRSFDYFERQMGQVPPAMIYLCGEGIGQEKITEEFLRAAPAPVEFLSFEKEINLPEEGVDDGIVQLCLGAMGAAFRAETI